MVLIFPDIGLQECPTSGLLWSMAIWQEPRPTRKSRSADALRKAADDPLIICTVARLFWAERKIEKARQWFERAVKTNPDLGDVWGWWLKFERQHGIPVSALFVYNFVRKLTVFTGAARRCRQTLCHRGTSSWSHMASGCERYNEHWKDDDRNPGTSSRYPAMIFLCTTTPEVPVRLSD